MNKDIIRQHLSCFRFIPADIIYLTSREKAIIDADLERNLDETPYHRTCIGALNFCLLFEKPFRNVFYYRMKHSLILRNISRVLLKPLDTIEINGEIDEGFRIYHNYAVIHPQKAGRNLTVGHGVTIGKGSPKSSDDGFLNPIIGHNVTIMTNAIVFGGIKIGNDTTIGAGAVITKDVPDNCVVVGNPAYIIRNNGKRTEIRL